ncbi:MAG: transposase [Lachnospiraceae bacterium]|nr:transposase [Lachnospiraceae bacterium]
MSSTGIYHIILRPVNQHIIFEEESDYQKFLYILSDCKKKYDSDIFAYCLMDNHVHLLLRTGDEKLSGFFQSLGTRFVRWYNSKYSRSGHLFQDRFYSSVIESDKAFLSALVYIHNNPVKANMCRYASEYRWSSINAFYGAKNPLVNVSFSYKIAGTKDSLLLFFAKKNDSYDNTLFENDHRNANHFLTDEKALAVFRSVSHLKSTSDVSSLGKVQRNQYVRSLKSKGLSIRQIARIMDISETTVKRICKMD